jgi:hypothetical protein
LGDATGDRPQAGDGRRKLQQRILDAGGDDDHALRLVTAHHLPIELGLCA